MGALLFVLIVVNLAVCVGVARSRFYTHAQMWMQAALVWLFPLLGAVLVGIFLWTQYAQAKASRGTREGCENWQNPADTTHHVD